MTLSSKHVVGYALALVVLGLAAWMSSSLLLPQHKPAAIVGSIEVTPLGN